jgi:hypothetical protein
MTRVSAFVLVAAWAISQGPLPASAASEWNEPELVAEHVLGGPVGIQLSGLVEPGGRSTVCWSEGKIGAWRVVVARRDAKGSWTRTDLAATQDEVAPRVLRASDGTLVVAWGAFLTGTGGGYSLLPNGGSEWTKPRPIHEKCSGPVALGAADGKVVAAYIRPVTKLDLRNPARDFVHDPYVQGFDKPAVAVLGESGWTETALLQRDDLLRCNSPPLAGTPALAGDGVLYFRQEDGKARELAWAPIAGKRSPEVVSASSAFRFGTSAAGSVQSGEPLVAFCDDAGVVLRRRTTTGWTSPRLLVAGMGHGIRMATTPDTIHVVAVTGAGPFAPSVLRYVTVTGEKVEPVSGVPAGASCDLCLDDGTPVLFIAQQAKATDVITSEYRIVTVRRTK